MVRCYVYSELLLSRSRGRGSTHSEAKRGRAIYESMIPTFMLETDIVPPCSTVDPDSFFPVDDFSEKPTNSSRAKTYENERAVKAICGECPLRIPCAVYAIQTNPQGIWGGTTESERTAIRRGRGVKIQKALGLVPTRRR